MPEDDVTIESEEENSATQEQKLKTLRDKLKTVQKERDEYLAGWQRAKADYVNLERRMRAAGEGVLRSATKTVALGFIPALDSLEAAAKANEGLGAILKQVDAALREHGIIRFLPKAGELFDPARHESVQTLATENKPDDNTVSETLQSGYEMDGEVIRPARVTIKHYG